MEQKFREIIGFLKVMLKGFLTGEASYLKIKQCDIKSPISSVREWCFFTRYGRKRQLLKSTFFHRV